MKGFCIRGTLVTDDDRRFTIGRYAAGTLLLYFKDAHAMPWCSRAMFEAKGAATQATQHVSPTLIHFSQPLLCFLQHQFQL